MSIGGEIKKLREQNNLTVEELALKTGTDITILNFWENNLAKPISDDIFKICKYFSITADELYWRSENDDRKYIAKTKAVISKKLWENIYRIVDKKQDITYIITAVICSVLCIALYWTNSYMALANISFTAAVISILYYRNRKNCVKKFIDSVYDSSNIIYNFYSDRIYISSGNLNALASTRIEYNECEKAFETEHYIIMVFSGNVIGFEKNKVDGDLSEVLSLLRKNSKEYIYAKESKENQ